MYKYVIVNTSEIEADDSAIDLSQLPFDYKEEFRYSLDGTKACIKYSTPLPSFFSGKTTYTYSQILPIIQGSEWTEVVTAEDLGL